MCNAMYVNTNKLNEHSYLLLVNYIAAASLCSLTCWTLQCWTVSAWTPATPGNNLRCCSQHSDRSRLGCADMAERKTDWWRAACRLDSRGQKHQSMTTTRQNLNNKNDNTLVPNSSGFINKHNQ